MKGLLVQCNRADACERANRCEAGKIHSPDFKLDEFGHCQDYRPYTEGGVYAWGEVVEEKDLR